VSCNNSDFEAMAESHTINHHRHLSFSILRPFVHMCQITDHHALFLSFLILSYHTCMYWPRHTGEPLLHDRRREKAELEKQSPMAPPHPLQSHLKFLWCAHQRHMAMMLNGCGKCLFPPDSDSRLRHRLFPLFLIYLLYIYIS
jgi:hypothetical protein